MPNVPELNLTKHPYKLEVAGTLAGHFTNFDVAFGVGRFRRRWDQGFTINGVAPTYCPACKTRGFVHSTALSIDNQQVATRIKCTPCGGRGYILFAKP
jgi:hypothetical protein